MRPCRLYLFALVVACGTPATTTDAGMDASNDAFSGPDCSCTDAGSGPTTITVLSSMGSSLVSFPIGASGNVAPSTLITGASTNITSASALAADAQGNLYVSTELAILVFPPNATGNVVATRTIAGPNALPSTDDFVSVAVAPDGTIYAASELPSGTSRNPKILVFPPGANGNVAPTATITGAATTMQAVLAMGVDERVGRDLRDERRRDDRINLGFRAERQWQRGSHSHDQWLLDHAGRRRLSVPHADRRPLIERHSQNETPMLKNSGGVPTRMVKATLSLK